MPGHPPDAKLYVVARTDLPPGAQATQAAHAALDFAVAFPEITRGWNHHTNVLILLGAPDEAALHELILQAEAIGLPHLEFREPDLDDTITAVCISPSGQTSALCAQYDLLLREETTPWE